MKPMEKPRGKTGNPCALCGERIPAPGDSFVGFSILHPVRYNLTHGKPPSPAFVPPRFDTGGHRGEWPAISECMDHREPQLLNSISLDDKYELEVARAYLTGIEALVRLPILQHQRDLEAGLNTAGFVSGYRGSPVGTVDQSMWKAKTWLDRHRIVFQPGVNEDLAATAVWGTQQTHLMPAPLYDGVFSMWYGKGPGVDRSMDVIKHANAFGTTRFGGVLAVAGDDHACKSSTTAHQSEHMLIGAAVPVLNPANVQEVLDYGIVGWALSRYSGCWVGLKAITENMDSAISADIDPNRVQITLPEDFEEPECGLNAQWPTTPLEQEWLLHKYRIYAARAFAHANHLNQIVLDSPNPRLGIVTTGKTYLDVMEALDNLGIGTREAREIGLRIFKVGMSWPLEPVSMRRFARGLHEILVVEEKRSILENQVTGQLYNRSAAERPRVVGEFDEYGNGLVTNLGELTPAIVARAIGSRIARFHESSSIVERLEFLDARERRLARPQQTLTRTPYFCSGCPHNTSTRIPDGSVGMAGIGCHYMVKWMDRNTETFTHMGGEGASWIGIAPFSGTDHVFQNIGDGTYFHSGILAIRAAIASGVNITYKILFNDAVAMTGGQPVDGSLTLPELVAQLQAEGVQRLAVVAEDSKSARLQLRGCAGIAVHDRREFDRLQREMREIKGTSIIVYDQRCASEKRRRRKRGLMPQSPVRVFINPDVCEGCGDCSTASNCLSVLPKKTELGTKRQIDQSACNQDFSCLDGFCPSFVTVEGAELPSGSHQDAGENSPVDIRLDDPPIPELDRPWNVLVTGIGGTGVLTVGSLLAMAAHLEGKGCSTLNQTGLAQKFGAVVSHVRIAGRQPDIHAMRISDGGADLLLGCDLVVSAMPEALSRLDPKRSYSVINTYENPTADFIHNDRYEFPGAQMRSLIAEETGEGKAHFVNATRVARNLLGDSIGSNLFLLGYAYQKGMIPVDAESVNRAIELNGVAVEFNQQAFLWGRRAAVDQPVVELHARGPTPVHEALCELDDIIRWRYDFLVKYQNQAYADRYRKLVDAVRQAESELNGNPAAPLAEAVARNHFKLMAYKDEYEIARLYSDGEFLANLKNQFTGEFRISFHLAPPGLSKKDPLTGHLQKRRFPGATLQVFKVLSRFRFLRGTALDPFGRTPERRLERQLIREYEDDIGSIVAALNEKNYPTAIAIAGLPEMVKGFGHIKMANIEKFQEARKDLFVQFREPEFLLVVNQ